MKWVGWPAATALAAVDAAVLVAFAPAPARLGADLAAAHDWFARAGVDGAVATLAAAALWLVALWLGVGLAAAAATRLPGAVGGLAARVCRLVLPRVVRNVLVGSAGLGVLLASVAAGAAVPPAPASAVSAETVPVPAPSWPVSPPAGVGSSSSRPAPGTPAPATASPGSTSPATTSVPVPTWPSTAVPTRTAPAPPHRAGAPTAPRRVARTSGSGEAVTVRAGDSLWLIAARRLGPQANAAQIAQSWPRWYAANRGVVGDDPAVITPGQVLHTPPVHTASAPTEEANR